MQGEVELSLEFVRSVDGTAAQIWRVRWDETRWPVSNGAPRYHQTVHVEAPCHVLDCDLGLNTCKGMA